MLIELFKKARWMARQAYRTTRRRMLGAKLVPPNYVFVDRFAPGGIAIDVGTGDDPDFSRHLMANYGVECFAVDPTRKHAPALQQIERDQKLFHYLPFAVGPRNGQVEFHESQANVSGSFLKEHLNIIKDPVKSYPVEMVTFAELLRRIGRPRIEIAKLDLEGVEYEVIAGLSLTDVEPVLQLLVEFHHEYVEGISRQDTSRAIAKVRSLGFKAFVFNGRDCLFYR